MAKALVAAEELLPELRKLSGSIQEAADEAVSFRQQNAQFDERNETVQLLNNVAEQLFNQRMAMEHANFEEHSSELHYLCQRFTTTVDQGLPDSVYSERAMVALLSRKKKATLTREKKNRHFFPCCSSEFPPQQAWWLSTQQFLVPKFQVLRGGNLSLQSAIELVPGDIVYLCAGQQAATDARVLATSGGAAVDVSYLTSQVNDVRICSPTEMGSSVTESRNILLKDGHIISGSLFCMVVRSTVEPLIPPTTDGGQDIYEARIDMTVPAGLSSRTLQSLFKSLCIKASLFCKSFKVIEQLGGTHYIVVLLTQELLKQGTVPALCSALKRLRRAVILVNCNVGKEQLLALCEKLGVDCSDFEEPSLSSTKECQLAEDQCEVASARSIDVSLCTLLVGRELISSYEEGCLTKLMDRLQAESCPTIVINGMSEASLFKLCRQLGQPDKPMLYVMSDFFYSKCFRTLAVDMVHQDHCRGASSLMGGISEESTQIPATPQIPAGGDRYLAPHASLEKQPQSPYESAGAPSPFSLTSTITSVRTDPAQALRDKPRHSKGSQVFASMNSIGIVSEYSDCIFLKKDLALLGQSLDIISKKLRR